MTHLLLDLWPQKTKEKWFSRKLFFFDARNFRVCFISSSFLIKKFQFPNKQKKGFLKYWNLFLSLKKKKKTLKCLDQNLKRSFLEFDTILKGRIISIWVLLNLICWIAFRNRKRKSEFDTVGQKFEKSC